MPPFLLFVLTGIALAWPALINRGPFWYADTSTYLRGADAAWVTLTGRPTIWSDRITVLPFAEAAPAANFAAATPPMARGTLVPKRPVLTGRSIYYGMLIYLPMLWLGTWAAVLVQCFSVAAMLLFALRIIARKLDPQSLASPALTLGVVALATPLPFFACMFMPDVYAGGIVLMAALAMWGWEAMTRWERVVAIAAGSIIATFHSTFVLLALAMGLAGVCFARGLAARLRAVAIVAPMIVTGLASAALFSLAIEHRLGQKPISPPFLSARITAAGPGTDYLKRHCGPGRQNRFALCGHLGRLPLESDNFLWSAEASTGLFQLADPAEQRRIAGEDKQLLFAVIADDPFGFVAFALASSAEQLVRFNLIGFNRNPQFAQLAQAKLPGPVASAMRRTRAAEGTMPVDLSLLVIVAVTAFSAVVLAALFGLAALGRAQVSRPALRLAALLVFGVFANAAICGTLSGPHGRYQMRIDWMLPLAAIIAASGIRRRVPEGAATGRVDGLLAP